jgi:probable phosphoglycerate mutase
METCRLAGLVGEPRDDLREWNYGSYEGRTTAEIHAERPGWDLWRDGCPGGETVQQVGQRADRVLAELRTVTGNSAVFAHGHLLRVLGARWLGLPAGSGALFALSTAAISLLGHERDRAVFQLWNDVGS